MRIQAVEISNFRSLRSFSLKLDEASVLLVSENAAGKSSFLNAIAKAFGRDRGAAYQDFSDAKQPIEVKLTLSGFERADQAIFPKELSFVGKPTLRIGFKATWDPNEHEIETICGFPDHGWKQASRQQREALPLFWLSSFRDPARVLQLAASRGFLPRLISARSLDSIVESAAQGVATALGSLTGDAGMTALLQELRDRLSTLTPGVDQTAFKLGVQSSPTEHELLREFELLLSHGGASVPVTRQSHGLAQLAIFSCLLSLLTNEARAIVLVDEPEVSLHPHAQRALSSALRALPNQTIIATHSSNILDRADLRSVVRFQSKSGGVEPHRATSLSEPEAQRLARFVNPLTAEACFARKVVLVEGYSDRVVLLHLASRRGRDLDAEGVSVVSLDGGCAIGTFLRLFGAPGLGLDVFGLCDEDKEALWLSEIVKVYSQVTDRATMQRAGYFVCVRDLEEEFIGALGIAAAEAIIDGEGMTKPFQGFCKQTSQLGVGRAEQLRRYFHNDSTRWAVPIVAALDLSNIPGALNGLLSTL